MEIFELFGHVDDAHQLQVNLPPSIPAGPVKIILKPVAASESEEEDDWAQAISMAWMQDWSDPREDIYTLEDGEPVDGGTR